MCAFNLLNRIPLHRLPNHDYRHPIERINYLQSGLKRKYSALSQKKAFEPIANDHDVSRLHHWRIICIKLRLELFVVGENDLTSSFTSLQAFEHYTVKGGFPSL